MFPVSSMQSCVTESLVSLLPPKAVYFVHVLHDPSSYISIFRDLKVCTVYLNTLQYPVFRSVQCTFKVCSALVVCSDQRSLVVRIVQL